jgi:hypothetical protein
MQIRWNTFHGSQYQAKGADEPRVTLDKRGVFYLNEAAWNALSGPAAVEFSADDSGRIFGMKGCDPRKANAFSVRAHSGSKTYHRISAAAFFHHLRMPLDRTVLFRNIDLDDTGVLILDMNTSVTVSRGAR